MMQAAFPGSFLPFGPSRSSAAPSRTSGSCLRVSGRLDYIETIRQWDKRTEAWNPQMALLKLRLIPKWLTSSDFRFAFTSGASSNLVCFERRADGSLQAGVREGMSSPPFIVRLAASWLTNAILLGVVVVVLPEVKVHNAGSLIAAAAVFGVLNTLLKPLLRLHHAAARAAHVRDRVVLRLDADARDHAQPRPRFPHLRLLGRWWPRR